MKDERKGEGAKYGSACGGLLGTVRLSSYRRRRGQRQASPRAGNSLTSQASAHIVIFSIDRQRPIGPDPARKGLPIDLHKPSIRIDRLGNLGQRREGRVGYPRRLIATGACLVGPLVVVVAEIRF